MKVTAKINGTEVWTIWTEYLPSIMASIEQVIQEDGIVIIKPTNKKSYELQNYSERNQSEKTLRGDDQRESEDQEGSNENRGLGSGSEEVPGRKPTRKSRRSDNTVAGSGGAEEVV